MFFFLLNNWIWQEYKTSYMTQITEVIFGKHTTNRTEMQMQINQPQIRWVLMFMVRKESWTEPNNTGNWILDLTMMWSVKVVAWSGKPSRVKKDKIWRHACDWPCLGGPGEGSCRSPDWPTGSAVDSALVEREWRREAARGQEEGWHPRNG